VNDLLASVRRGSRSWRLAAILAVLFLAGHLPFLASTLEDIDSVNFALGLRDFDPGSHRPHPPGYPIYMALGKLADTVLSEPRALAIWGVLFGALTAFALLRVFACLDALDGGQEISPGLISGAKAINPGAISPVKLARDWISPPAMAVLLTMTAPLYWMTASRPMSDMAGLAAIVAAQALLLTAMVRSREAASAGVGAYDAAALAQSGRLVLMGAFAAAIAIGFRSQAMWLTLPLLALVIVDRAGRGAAGAIIGSMVWLAVGTLLWFVPLVIASGGPRAYLDALGSQAGEDWSGVDLLATNFGLRRLAFALDDTFVSHWGLAAGFILVWAVVGAIVLLWSRRRALVAIVAVFGPYLIFHLLFQETVTTRYALPLVVPIAYLASRGLFQFRALQWPVLGVFTASLCLTLVVPVMATYARFGSPVTRALAEVRAEAATTPGMAVGMHHPFARPVEADPIAPAVALASKPRHEWLSLVERWRSGARGPVWFLADPDRTDLALVDPQARMLRAHYAWPFSSQVYLGGIRPDRLDWVVINEPGWFAGEGWQLTPETAGVAKADGAGLGRGPISAWLKRRDGEVVLLVGGRHLGKGAGPAARVWVRIDGREIDAWRVDAARPSYLKFLRVPSGGLKGDGLWATLEIAAAAADTGKPTGIVDVEQFDAQDPATPMIAFGDGWQEPEHNPATGMSWRWASGRSTLHVSSTDRDIELQIVGESPARYFPRPSRVVVTAGTHQIMSVGVASDFAWTTRVPAAALRDSGGTITIETDQAFKPADRGQSADRRDLGLRIYYVKIRPVS
jgi:hypothetical protein